jgi:Uma2 family endonuclease
MLHESLANLIGRMIETWSLEVNLEILSAKSTTLLRPDLEKGVEADECYYIGSADAVRGLNDIDLTIHPPPDLVIEIDISRSSRIKLPLYAALGVPEVWRYDGETIQVLASDEGRLVAVTDSRVLPGFPLQEANRLVALRSSLGETALIQSFRDFVRAHTT